MTLDPAADKPLSDNVSESSVKLLDEACGHEADAMGRAADAARRHTNGSSDARLPIAAAPVAMPIAMPRTIVASETAVRKVPAGSEASGSQAEGSMPAAGVTARRERRKSTGDAERLAAKQPLVCQPTVIDYADPNTLPTSNPLVKSSAFKAVPCANLASFAPSVPPLACRHASSIPPLSGTASPYLAPEPTGYGPQLSSPSALPTPFSPPADQMHWEASRSSSVMYQAPPNMYLDAGDYQGPAPLYTPAQSYTPAQYALPQSMAQPMPQPPMGVAQYPGPYQGAPMPHASWASTKMLVPSSSMTSMTQASANMPPATSTLNQETICWPDHLCARIGRSDSTVIPISDHYLSSTQVNEIWQLTGERLRGVGDVDVCGRLRVGLDWGS